MSTKNYVNNRLNEYKYFSVKATQGASGRPSSGLIYGWKRDLDFEIVDSDFNFVLILDVKNNVFILFMYLQPNHHYQMALSAIFSKVLNLCNQNKKIIILGDLNGRIGLFNTTDVIRNSRDTTLNKRGKQLIIEIANCGLLIGNGVVNGDINGNITFVSESNLGCSVVDLLLFSPSCLQVIKEFTVLPFNQSDHFPICVSLCTNTTFTTEARMVSAPKLKIPSSLARAELSTKIKQKLSSLHQSADVNIYNEDVVNSIVSTFESNNLVTVPKQVSDKPKWFNEECKSLKFNTNHQLRIMRRNTDPSIHPFLIDNYKEARNIYHNLLLLRKKLHTAKVEQSLSNHKNSKSFWSAYRSLNYTPQVMNSISRSSWLNHYNNVFSNQAYIVSPPINLPSAYPPDPILDREFNALEIKLTIKQLKPRKAPGIDRVPNEAWSLGSGVMLRTLCTLFQRCFDSGVVPTAWCEAIILPILKKGDKSLTCNYRPISLLNSITKLFTSILNSRLNTWICINKKLSQFQAGFQKRRSCIDHIFILNSLIQMQLLKDKKLYCCFVDLSQAFDSPPHHKVWEVLLATGVSLKFVRIFKFIYEHASARVKTKEGLTDVIRIMKGVLQGESASPAIFNLYIEGIVSCLAAKNIAGIQLTSSLVHILLYADDMVLVAPSKETLQMKIDVAANFLASRGLKVNLGKTKVVVFAAGGFRSRNEEFNWRREKIEIVRNYVYLGVMFHSTGSFSQAAENSVSKGISAQGVVLSTLKRQKTLNLETSSKLYDSIIQSTTLYAAGVWGLGMEKKLERVQQQFFKRILNLPSCTPGYFVRLETGRAHTALEVTKLGLQMLNRIVKSPQNCLLKQAYNKLRSLSLRYPNKNCSWFRKMYNLLDPLGMQNILNINPAIISFSSRKRIILKHRESLGVVDLESAKNSTFLPIYESLVVSCSCKPYFHVKMPIYLTSTVIQTRLGLSIIFNKGSWHNLGQFEECYCKFCGERDSFPHLFDCENNQDLRRKFPFILPNSNNIFTDQCNLQNCKNMYIFITTALKRRN